MQILFITSGSIGDAIISTGILGKLMDDYPEAEFTVAVGPAAVALFKDCPRIKRTIAMVKQSMSRHWLLLWQQTMETTWDLIVDLRSSVISYILNTRHRRIFKKPDKSISKAEQLAALMGFLPPPPPRLWVGEEAREEANALLPSGKTLIVLAPKTNSVFKDWPLDRFIELARRLYKQGIVFIVMASVSQHQAMQPLVRTLPAEQVLDLSGRTTLPVAYAIIERAKLFVGNDSGLLHMAAAAKTPSVGIYGPSNDKTYAPRGEHLRILTAYDFQPGEEEKKDASYIKKITVDQVETAVRDLGVLK